MKPRPPTGRRLTNLLVSLFATHSAVLACCSWPGSSGSWWGGPGGAQFTFFTQLPTPPGMEGGGLVNAMVGTLVMTLLATLTAVPLGLLAGVFLAEFGQGSRLADNTRFFSQRPDGHAFYHHRGPSPMSWWWCRGKILRLCRYPGPGHHHATHCGPDHRGHAAAGPQYPAGSRPGPGAPRWRITLDIVFPGVPGRG